MVWQIEYSASAQEQLRKLDRQVARRIVDFMSERIAVTDEPRDRGKALVGPLGGLWRYRVGDYRVICEIRDNLLRILVVRVASRADVYR